jgi:ubiquinone/menaquinone biosynthesis C-methylase UbiE
MRGNDTKRLQEIAEKVLRDIGVKAGHEVLDFGCGSGTYAIPAAMVVGAAGKVYALDKESRKLDELMRKAESIGLGNIRRMKTSGKLKIELEDECIDVVLLYDILHEFYFPIADDRKALLLEVSRVLKPHGFLSVWPKHMESKAEEEIENANFYLESKHFEMLIHDDNNLEKGQVLNFSKTGGKSGRVGRKASADNEGKAG